MIKREIVIDQWNASYFDNLYDDTDKLKSTIDRKKQIPLDTFIKKLNTPT